MQPKSGIALELALTGDRRGLVKELGGAFLLPKGQVLLAR